MEAASYRIAMLTPYAWTVPGGVNNHIAALAERYTSQGHRVTIIAPSDDKADVKAARERVRAVLLGERESLFTPDEPYPRYFFAGGTFSVRHNRSVSYLSPPVDLLSNVDVVLENEEFDVLHIHEPFVPSLGWSAMNHAESPIVATFHANSERFFWYWLGKPILSRVFPVFDAVVAVSPAARDTAARYFEGDYHVVPNGIDLERFHPPARRLPGPLRVLYVGGDSRRKGLSVLLRALRFLPDNTPTFELLVCGSDEHELKFGHLVPERFRGSVSFRGRVPHDELPEIYGQADVFCAPSLGNESFGIVLLEAMATRTAVLASDIDGYRGVVTDGREGLLVRPREVRALARGLARLLADDALREEFAARGLETVRRYSWDIVAGEVMQVYGDVIRRRLKMRSTPSRRVDPEFFADCHVHTNHSRDCAVPVDDLLERAAEVGLDVVAVTDHNEIAGALEAAEIADRYGVRVIIGEEVKTLEGEVIGLFLNERIPPGLTFAETIAEIKGQGGVVYVPHPFDRLHTVPGSRLLKANLTDLDVIEVFNSRIAYPGFNEKALRFSQRHRLPGAAGSDAHVLPGLGTALTGIGAFRGPRDFVEALAASHIIRRPRSLLYLQSLKLIQTSLDGAGRVSSQGGARQG
jgi:glycosyltransferase involved in cell wall biosynthesis